MNSLKISKDNLICALTSSFDAQAQKVAEWHLVDPVDEYIMPHTQNVNLKTLQDTILAQHFMNFKLWHIEDEARRTDVSSEFIANCKRSIDQCNQARNDRIEAVDFCLVELIKSLLVNNNSANNSNKRHNTEPPGLAIDRLSILALKVFHMQEQTSRTDTELEHKEACQKKLDILLEQRQDIAESLCDLISDYISGEKKIKVYYQFKMYNDPNLNPALYNNAK